MRWIAKKSPEYGNTRIIKKFALLPVFIGYERRWLEYVVYEQTFNRSYPNYECSDSECWRNTRFL